MVTNKTGDSPRARLLHLEIAVVIVGIVPGIACVHTPIFQSIQGGMAQVPWMILAEDIMMTSEAVTVVIAATAEAGPPITVGAGEVLVLAMTTIVIIRVTAETPTGMITIAAGRGVIAAVVIATEIAEGIKSGLVIGQEIGPVIVREIVQGTGPVTGPGKDRGIGLATDLVTGPGIDPETVATVAVEGAGNIDRVGRLDIVAAAVLAIAGRKGVAGMATIVLMAPMTIRNAVAQVQKIPNPTTPRNRTSHKNRRPEKDAVAAGVVVVAGKVGRRSVMLAVEVDLRARGAHESNFECGL